MPLNISRFTPGHQKIILAVSIMSTLAGGAFLSVGILRIATSYLDKIPVAQNALGLGAVSLANAAIGFTVWAKDRNRVPDESEPTELDVEMQPVNQPQLG